LEEEEAAKPSTAATTKREKEMESSEGNDPGSRLEDGKARSGRTVVSDTGESKGSVEGEEALEDCGESGIGESLLLNLPQ
jgi:hypothetical protein